jgi:hypothetical protein
MADAQYATFPTDPEAIKRDVKLRREAVRMCMAEITALLQQLRKVITPAEYLKYQSETFGEAEADMMGVAKEKAAAPDPDDPEDAEWQEYLKKGNASGK